MRTHCDCFPCLARHVTELVKAWTPDETQQLALLQPALAALAQADARRSPPDITCDLYNTLAHIAQTDDFDPYRQLKDDSTAYAWQIRRHLDRLPGWHPDAFEARLRLAIAGNVLDFSIFGDLKLEDALDTLSQAFSQPLDADAIDTLQRRIDEAHSILYLLDNCGEAVFDSLFIEAFRHKVTLVVRALPASNDVTRRELAASGLANLPVLDNAQRLPGLVPAKASPELQQALKQADLIIAKGQGNFECLNDENLPLVFLFMAKCPVVIREINARPKSLQIRFK